EQSRVIFEEITGGPRDELRVTEWLKMQELRAGKCVLWDHHFELPGQHLEAERAVLESVQVGKVSHKLKLGSNGKLELYDYPGGYAQRFDGIDRGGGERPADLQKIFEDNKRTVAIRMEEEAAGGIRIEGAANWGQFAPGHSFAPEPHFSADGPYVIPRVEHSARLGPNYRSGEGDELFYGNKFTCLPAGLPFRPPRVTPKPVMQGLQT